MHLLEEVREHVAKAQTPDWVTVALTKPRKRQELTSVKAAHLRDKSANTPHDTARMLASLAAATRQPRPAEAFFGLAL